MKKFLIFLALLLIPAAAKADGYSSGTGCSLSNLAGCTYAGAQTAPSFNVTTDTGYQSSGITILTGQAGTGYTKVGENACPSLSVAGSESVCLGVGAGNLLTGIHGVHSTIIGAFSDGLDTTGDYVSTLGTDTMRNSVGSSSAVVLGHTSGLSYFGQREIAAGTGALRGNSASILLGGTATNGDVITITVTPTSGTPSPQTFSTTVTGGESLQAMVAGLSSALGAQSTLAGNNYYGTTNTLITSLQPVLGFNHQGTNSVGDRFTLSANVSGAATETVTITYPTSSSGDIIALGASSVDGLAIGSANNLVAIGPSTLASVSTANNDVAIGGNDGQNITTGHDDTIVGVSSGTNLTTANNATVYGAQALQDATTNGATCFGFRACQHSTTGSPTVFGSAGGNLTSGLFNAVFGDGALNGAANSTAGSNSVFGQREFQSVTTAGGNEGLGFSNGQNCTTCSNNILIGNTVFASTFQTGNDNIIFSTRSVDAATAGTSDTFAIYGHSATAIMMGTGTNNPTTMAFTLHGSTMALPDIASATAAQTGTLCWSASTITYDPSLGCLTSSVRFKKDVKSLDGALATIMNLRPVSFSYSDGRPDTAVQVGLIAEEVNKVDPRLVGYDSDGITPRGVRYAEYTAMLTKAIQEQQAEIAELKATMKPHANDNHSLWCKVFNCS